MTTNYYAIAVKSCCLLCDIEGQQKLLAANVLIVGAGGLGSPAAMYLAAAGIGSITIYDDDVVDLSNLQRQIAHHTPDIGTDKVISTRQTLNKFKSGCQCKGGQAKIDWGTT